MKVKITLDYFDGRTKEIIRYTDAVDFRQLTWQMMEGEICGFTVSKWCPLRESLTKAKIIKR